MLEVMTNAADRSSVVRQLVVDRLEYSYNLARLLTGDRALAEEATHEAVIRALRAADGLRDPAAFDAWFRRILVNSCRDALRHRRDRVIPGLSPPSVVPDPAPRLAERDAMSQALASLTAEHREVIVLRFYADLPVEAIAASLGIRVGTAKSRLHRALEQLRAAYDASARPPAEVSR